MKLGEKLKLLRKERKLTLDALSRLSEVGKATLSRIENGVTAGNLNTHLKICNALNINLSQFYKELEKSEDKISVSDNKKLQDAEVFAYDESVTSTILFKPSKNKRMLPQLLKIASGKATPIEESPLGTDKFIYCLEGTVELKIADKTYTLKETSSIYFDSSMPHAIKNTGSTTAKLLLVVSPVAL